MRQLHNDNRGMTLIEMLVGIVIAMIAIAAMGGILLSATSYFTGYADEREAKMILDTIYDNMADNITYATNLCLSESKELPEGWTKEDGYIGFESYDKNGVIFNHLSDNIYGDEFYVKGKVKATCTYHNGDTKSLSVDLQYTGKDDEAIYKRKRTINILNLTAFETEVEGKESLNNDTAKIYLHYRKESQSVAAIPTATGQEYEIYQVLQRIYNETVTKDPTYYVNATNSTPVYIGDVKIGTAANPHAILGWQYRGDPEGNNWVGGSKETSFMTLTKDELDAMGVGELLTTQPAPNGVLYYLPYHYVANTSQLDLLLYTNGSSYFDNVQSGFPRETNLIFIQEENAWYYYKAATTQGNSGSAEITSGSSKGGVPIANGAKMTYKDSKGTYTVTISSSMQVKQFFKKYGIVVTKS